MQTQAPSRHLPIRKEWLAATQEPALEPDRPIIDPHHHLWDRPGYRYLFPELLADERFQADRRRLLRRRKDGTVEWCGSKGLSSAGARAVLL